MKAGETNSDEVAIVQQPYAEEDRMLWKISESATGGYIVRPKSGEQYSTDWCLCAGDYIFGFTSGLNVEQQRYIDNDSYMDEWFIEAVLSYSIMFYGVSNSGVHVHDAYLRTAKETLHSIGYNNVILKTGSMSASECLDDLKSCNIFTSRSHGDLPSDFLGGSTGIILNDDSDQNMVALYSHPFASMTPGSASISATDSFENLDIALFIGCYTGYGGVNGNNLPAVVVSQGAEVAIGFSVSISCDGANDWTAQFYSSLLQGKTVLYAASKASETVEESHPEFAMANVVICGNGSYRLGE